MSELYLPAACTECERITLIPAALGVSACPRCSSPVVVVPGEAYRAADVPLFKRIESIIHASHLSLEDGGRIVNALTDVVRRVRHPENCLSITAEIVPSLQFLQDAFPNQRGRLA